MTRSPSLRTIFLLIMSIVLVVSGCAELPSDAAIDDRRSKNADRRNSSTPNTVAPSTKVDKTTPQATPQTKAETKVETKVENKAETKVENKAENKVDSTTQKNTQKTVQTNQSAPSDTDKSSANTKKSQASDAEPVPDVDPAGFYTVKEGDNLLKIASQFNRMAVELTEWNGLANPNAIKVGQVLRVAPPDNVHVMRVPVDPDTEIRRGGRPIQPPTSPQAAAPAVPVKKTMPSGQKIAYSDEAIAKLDCNEPATSRFAWPTRGKVIANFDSSSKGIDIAGKAGQPVVAAGDGKVLYAKNMRGYGNLIIIEHSGSMVTAYAHNKTILVREGQTVTQRQQIAEMGDSDADTVKLRFQVRLMGKPVDPAKELPTLQCQ